MCRRNDSVLLGNAATNTIMSLLEDRDGGTMLSFGLLAPLMFGVVGLGVDVTMWRMQKQEMQSALDSAAVAGAHAFARGSDSGAIQSAVLDELARGGFDATTGAQVDVSLADSDAGTSIAVSMSKPGDLYFSQIFLEDAPHIQAGAAGGMLDDGGGEVCILGLSEFLSDTVAFSGTADALVGCVVASNSSAADSLSLNGGAVLAASSVQAYGGIQQSSNATINSPVVWSYAPRIHDPYGVDGRNLQPPPSSTCDHNGNTSVMNTVTLSPGRYCGDLRIINADVTFEPGIYVIQNGDMISTGNSSLVGEGVVFVFTGTSAATIGGVDISGGTHVELSAPDDNDLAAAALGYQGIIFFQDSRAPTWQGTSIANNKFLGGSVGRFEGAVYFPSQKVIYTGGADANDGCLQLVALQVELRGNAAVGQNEETCELVGVEPIRSIKVLLAG